MTVRPRRSVLYMPGSNARALEKARELPADGLILDLEDAVAPEAKAQAREAIVKALRNGGFGSREVLVRINGLDTRWWVDDLHAVAEARPDAVLVPKISDPYQLQDLAARIVDMGTDPHIRVWAMMETPLAMLKVAEIAAAALDSETRLAGFVMGTNDLAKDTRARIVAGRAPMLPWLMSCVSEKIGYGYAGAVRGRARSFNARRAIARAAGARTRLKLGQSLKSIIAKRSPSTTASPPHASRPSAVAAMPAASASARATSSETSPSCAMTLKYSEPLTP